MGQIVVILQNKKRTRSLPAIGLVRAIKQPARPYDVMANRKNYRFVTVDYFFWMGENNNNSANPHYIVNSDGKRISKDHALDDYLAIPLPAGGINAPFIAKYRNLVFELFGSPDLRNGVVNEMLEVECRLSLTINVLNRLETFA